MLQLQLLLLLRCYAPLLPVQACLHVQRQLRQQLPQSSRLQHILQASISIGVASKHVYSSFWVCFGLLWATAVLERRQECERCRRNKSSICKQGFHVDEAVHTTNCSRHACRNTWHRCSTAAAAAHLVLLAGCLYVVCCEVALVFLQVGCVQQLHTHPPGACCRTKALQPCVCRPLNAAGRKRQPVAAGGCRITPESQQ